MSAKGLSSGPTRGTIHFPASTMRDEVPCEGRLRFDAYQVDLHTGEVRKHGLKVRLPPRPFQILALLLERPGELLTRKELQERLWPADTFVDFEHGVNAAIQTLRRALCDSHKQPRFIETLPRRGYRFIAAVERIQPDAPGRHLLLLLNKSHWPLLLLTLNGRDRLRPSSTKLAAITCCSPSARKFLLKCVLAKRPRTIWEFLFLSLLKNFCW